MKILLLLLLLCDLSIMSLLQRTTFVFRSFSYEIHIVTNQSLFLSDDFTLYSCHIIIIIT